jgi:hypothetical protein
MAGKVVVKPESYITTSWDDGHPLDLRVAELLAKHGLDGTFYVPRTAERETMTVDQLRQLSAAFEIGAHTLHHHVLTIGTEEQAWREIAWSKSWLEGVIGSPCVMFCPPKGKYASRHLKMIKEAGYIGARSVELLSLDFPRREAGIFLLPTTIQAYPHGPSGLVRNGIKRMAAQNLWRLIVHGRSTDWPTLALSLLRHSERSGGVFHLWGHSWELQEADQWRRLGEALQFIGEAASRAPSCTNGQLCQRALLRGESGDAAVQEIEQTRAER